MKVKGTKADQFIKSLPELVYPCKMEFDDGSRAEVAGIRLSDWQSTKFIAAMLSNPLIVDSVNFDPDKVAGLAFQQTVAFLKCRQKLTSR
jgi:hypothetical protein